MNPTNAGAHVVRRLFNLPQSSYWVKKELLKPEYQSILDSCTKGVNLVFRPSNADSSGISNIDFGMDDVALVRILSQPEFKIKFESKIDFEASNFRALNVARFD